MKPLILLHGALGSESLLKPLARELAADYEVHSLNLSGHGNAPFNTEGFGIDIFAEELLAFIESKQLHKPLIFGYSMGGYVALYLEATRPNTFEHIITLGSKFRWNPEVSQKEASRLKPEIIEEKVPVFANMLLDRHGDQWKDLLHATAAMMTGLGATPLLDSSTLASIQTTVTIMRGDQDNMVSEEESRVAAANIPRAVFLELKETPHPIEKVDSDLLTSQLRSYG